MEKYTRQQWKEWADRRRNLKWYQLEREPDGTPLILLFLKALFDQPVTWVGIGVLLYAIWQVAK